MGRNKIKIEKIKSDKIRQVLTNIPNLSNTLGYIFKTAERLT